MLQKLTAGIARYRRRLLAAAVVTVSVAPLALINGNAGAAAALPPQPGDFTGYGFDACTAPSSDTMAAWLKSSPYRAAGIYFGGNNRGCTQKNLTADWVREQVTRGWRLIPLYVGPQASCTTITGKRNLIDNRNAAAQGRATAEDAVRQATALGLAKESVLIYDMESYRTDDAACRNGVLQFMSAWSARLHDFGYFSGYYSSAASGIADQVAVYQQAGYVRPDYIDFARWDGVVTVTDKVVPASYWQPKRRMKQYRGAHKETWGGVTINIDNDYLDFARLPAAKLSDWNRNGWSDVLARTSSTGNLFAYPGNGTVISEGGRVKVGAYKSANALLRMDLNRDGLVDLIARTGGAVYFYPGLASGKFGARKQLYKNFGHMRELTSIGDFNRDGYPDLLGVQTSNGNVYLYPGQKGTKFGKRKVLAYGDWTKRSEFTGAGDFNRDGFVDLVFKLNSNNGLYLAAGKSGGLKSPVRIGSAAGFRDLLGIGDFDRDGYTDLAAVQSSTGNLTLFRGNGRVLAAGQRLSTGYKGRSPLF